MASLLTRPLFVKTRESRPPASGTFWWMALCLQLGWLADFEFKVQPVS